MHLIDSSRIIVSTNKTDLDINFKPDLEFLSYIDSIFCREFKMLGFVTLMLMNSSSSFL